VPILATLAAFANGPSVFRGLGELRVKESDRLEKTKELLVLAGAQAAVEGDDLIVRGGLVQVRRFNYDPAGDHRLAMCAAILAERCGDACTIQNKECVDVSFPGFFSLLESIC
jgi:3-phosphoshikimate 1-carboxyvinyltransferase